MDLINSINGKINSFVWGSFTLSLFLFVGIYFTLRLKGIQFSKAKLIIKKTLLSLFKKQTRTSNEKHSLSQFGSLSTALAATIGTGSIVGVATALTIGGSGSIFWMWVSAFLGMGTAYAENVLGILYRTKDRNGKILGGAYSYIEKGMNARWLAKLFALFCVLASFGMGNMAQGNSISASLSQSFNIPKIYCGILLFVFISVVMIGGTKRTQSVCELIVPFMTVFFLAGAVIILILKRERLIPEILSIFKNAFCFKSAAGGIAGAGVKKAVSIGIRRGVFSNEAGLGSTVSVHSSSNIKEPVEQGFWGIFEVFVDTMVVCTITALVILVSGAPLIKDEGAEIVVKAFESGFGNLGGYFVSVSIVLFALATLIGWSFIGENAFCYLFPRAKDRIYKIIFCIFVYLGAVSSLEFVWEISDTFNGLMAIPNLIALIILSKEVINETNRYFNQNGPR